MRLSDFSCVLARGSALFATSALFAANVDLPRYPAISPDGTTLVFSWRGDLWRAPSGGGGAMRLTSDAENDLRSAWTPDGARIVFESERDGARNLWSMRADGSDLVQLTFGDSPLALSAVGSLQGQELAFVDASIEGDFYRSPRPYKVSTQGGALDRLHDAFGNAAVPSPSGARLLFERGGSAWTRRGYNGPDNRDLWMWTPAGDAFARVTTYDGNDGFPRWIGEDEILFISDRGTPPAAGTMNLFRMKIAEGEASAVRLTTFDGTDVHSLTTDASGSKAIFGVMDHLYALDLKSPAAQPVELAFTAPDDALRNREFRPIGKDVTEAALSPDGLTLAVVAGGDVFVRATAEKSLARRVTVGEFRERELAWSPDGLTLYFGSDSDGSYSIFAATVAETRGDLKKEIDAVVAPPKVVEAPAVVAVEVAPVVQATPAAAAEVPAAVVVVPDEKKPEAKDDKKDDKKEEKKKDPKFDASRWADALRFDIKPIVVAADHDTMPVPSPDGKRLAFTRNLGDLAVLELASGEVKTLRAGFDPDLEYTWSPDGSFIAFAEDDQDFNKDIWFVAADGSSDAINITRHPDSDYSPRFSADGKVMAFLSERTNEEVDVWFVFLDKDLEALAAKDLEEYFKTANENLKKRKPLEAPVVEANPAVVVTPKAMYAELDLADAYRRVRRVTTLPGNEGNLELLPAGDKVLFSFADAGAVAAGPGDGPPRQGTLSLVKYDGTDLKKLTASGRVLGLSLQGDKATLVGPSGAQIMALPAGDAKGAEVSSVNEVDLAQLNGQKFDDVARLMGLSFYHQTMKGLDWWALAKQYRTLAEHARTNEEFDWVANRFIGHLDASHLGVRSPEPTNTSKRAQGRLGVATVECATGREVVEVLQDSAAARATLALKPGDIITSIDEDAVNPAKPLELLLAGKVGQECVIAFTRPAADGTKTSLRTLLVADSSTEERRLRYRAATIEKAALVQQWSNGKLGYIHIQGMDQASLDDFERDLYAAAHGKAGLIVDVRNNGGGWTADRFLASVMVKPYAYTMPRDGNPNDIGHYPQDRLFIQRYTMPMSMLCNEKSFSNAEIVAHAFKSLERGTLVGQQTYGGVISTGSSSLADGTTVRMPFRGWYLTDGTDMEEHGAKPDLTVVQTPEDESKNEDAQLRAAVEEMLKRPAAPGTAKTGV